ncbi:PREDICTED: probable enoyl-CoA hydratase, mitochondrial [Priapulus caudatus]|uniref:Probable enoyl-CoA hydratase, mitochondrial n=1 Tax=Priapulus caudatus TaxID=37621 RepID=A0ABM1E8V3_PRICU|nr:PREDICTED: probable enoyl-CoA hydratase, mitochondrial [Priapulus caudatus]XP_014668625.1 PREDICTED: probable enoyl-CoA hydratase, mitochondrial [Priapulus caudatus]
MDISKPVIAAIDGYAVAGGLELALMCDMRVVEESAIMGVYCRRFGVPLIDGGTVRLPAIIGLSRAMDMILTGRAITAKEALDWGLANRLVATGTSLGQAINLANSLIKFPQECLKMDKRSAYYATFDAKSIKDGLKFELNNASHVINTESVAGAEKFTQGIGRHGKFRLDPDIVGE